MLCARRQVGRGDRIVAPCVSDLVLRRALQADALTGRLLLQHPVDRDLVWYVNVAHHSTHDVRNLEAALIDANAVAQRPRLNYIREDHVHAPRVDGGQRPAQLNVVLQLNHDVRPNESLQNHCQRHFLLTLLLLQFTRSHFEKGSEVKI